MVFQDKERFDRQISRENNVPVDSSIHITYPVWKECGAQLGDIEQKTDYVKAHAAKSPEREVNTEIVDRWSTRWKYPLEALDGIAIEHPLSDWESLSSFTWPDPADYTDWAEAERHAKESREQGKIAVGSTDHGFLFLRSTYIRGYENAMIDFATEDERMRELIDGIAGYWVRVAKRWLDIGVDAIQFGDDLGLQNALPISPDTWRSWIKPSYKKVFSECRKANVFVGLHSDGYIVDIIPDLIDCGVESLNPQDLVNGLDNLEHLAKGKVHILLDIDRQSLTVRGTPEEIDKHVENCIRTLGANDGGLSLIWGVYPPTPPENILAVYNAMNKYATYHL